MHRLDRNFCLSLLRELLFLAVVGEARDYFSSTYRPVNEAKSIPSDPRLIGDLSEKNVMLKARISQVVRSPIYLQLYTSTRISAYGMILHATLVMSSADLAHQVFQVTRVIPP